jgi:hypothetical protein
MYGTKIQNFNVKAVRYTGLHIPDKEDADFSMN